MITVAHGVDKTRNQRRGIGCDIAIGEVQVVFKPDTGMSTGVNAVHHALLFLTAECTGKPVEPFQIMLQERFQIGGFGLEINAVAAEYKQHAAVAGWDHALFAVVKTVLQLRCRVNDILYMNFILDTPL